MKLTTGQIGTLSILILALVLIVIATSRGKAPWYWDAAIAVPPNAVGSE